MQVTPRNRTAATDGSSPGSPADGGISVGLVHDYLLVLRGAERVFAALAGAFPDAPLYTTLYDEQGTDGRFRGRDLRLSALQRLPVGQRRFRALLPLYPRAVERLVPEGEHDVVISSSSAFAHGVMPGPATLHLCYCHAPFRYVWNEYERTITGFPRLTRPAVRRTLQRIRRWDLEASSRVTRYLVPSGLSAERVAEIYGRSAVVVPPPVETHRFAPAGEPEDFFLFAGELVAHKRVEVALQAARRAGARMVVVGDGPDRRRLAAAHPEARFVGRVPDAEVGRLMARARALVVPNCEEFGIAAVEAQAAGRPVLALDEGGVRETVLDGLTGVRVARGLVDDFAEAMVEVDWLAFSPWVLRANAERFSVAAFQARVRGEVDRLIGSAALDGEPVRGERGVDVPVEAKAGHAPAAALGQPAA